MFGSLLQISKSAHKAVFSYIQVILFQKQPLEVFCKNGILKNVLKFTGKHLCQGLFLIKLQAKDLQLC